MEPLVSITSSPVIFLDLCKQIAYCNFKYKQLHRSAYVTPITIIIEFLTSQLWLGIIHLSWDAVINSIRLGGLMCSSKIFLQLNMCQELQIFAVVYMYSGAS